MDYELSSVEGLPPSKRRNGRTLLDKLGTDNENSALVTAVEGNDIGTVQQLLESGVDVNVSDSLGDTVLHVAARLGHVQLCALLVSQGADINAQNKASFTPLLLASRVSLQTVCVLLELGADMSLGNHLGEIPLHAASSSGLIDVIVLLVSSGSDVNARSFQGVTPLYLAIGSGSREAVKVLLRLGAEVNDVLTPDLSRPNTGFNRREVQSIRENLAVLAPDPSHPNTGWNFSGVQNIQENLATKNVRERVPKQKKLFHPQRREPEKVQLLDQGSAVPHHHHQPSHCRSAGPGQRQSRSGWWPSNGQRQSRSWPSDGQCQCGFWLPGGQPQGGHHDRDRVTSRDRHTQHEVLQQLHRVGTGEEASFQQPGPLSFQQPGPLSFQQPGPLSFQHSEPLSFQHSEPLFPNLEPLSCERCESSFHQSKPLCQHCEPSSFQYSEPSHFEDSNSELLVQQSKPSFLVNEPSVQPAARHKILSATKNKHKLEPNVEESLSEHSEDDSDSDSQQRSRNDHHSRVSKSADRRHILFSTCPILLCRKKREIRHRGAVTSSHLMTEEVYNENLTLSIPEDNWSALFQEQREDGGGFQDEPDPPSYRFSHPHRADVADKSTSQTTPPGLTPLHRACQLGMETVAQVLLEAGANVNARTARGETPLHVAAMYSSISGHGEVTGLIRLLLKAGTDIEAVTNSESSTPLHLAALVGDALSASLLISAGADLRKRDCQGNTPLHKACERIVSPEGNRLRTVRLLLMHGASARVVNQEGLSPLHVLLLHKTDDMDHDVVRALLNHHADPNQPTPSGEAPLLVALRSRMYGFAKVLVEKGADPNTPAGDGKTPLHYVCKDGHVSLFKLLWSKGGDPTTPDRDGFTPLRHAVENGEEALIRACVSSGASTWQCSCQVTSPSLSDMFDNPAQWSSPFLYVFSTTRLSPLVLLFSSGCFSFGELHRLRNICLTTSPDQLTSPSQQQVVNFILRVSQAPPSLQNVCRWKISHLIGCSADRKSRARRLGLPSLLRDFVLFVKSS